MPREVILPRVDMDMAEGKIALWHVADGDAVRKGQPLFEIETDKATMEVEAEADGVVRLVHTTLGEPLPVGEVVAWILQPGEAAPGATPGTRLDGVAPSGDAAHAGPTTETGGVGAEGSGSDVAGAGPGKHDNRTGTAAKVATSAEDFSHASTGQGNPGTTAAPAATATDAAHAANAATALLRATPLARSLARQHGIALGGVRGSGEGGRIHARDLQLPGTAPAPSGLPAPSAPSDPSTTTPMPGAPLHLQWFTRGTGTPLLLVHGFGADLGSWRPLLVHLQGVPALGIDLPNHGKSPLQALDGFDALAQALLQRIDSEGIHALHLAGHSLGGGAALVLAGLLGPRLRSLTLMAPAGFGPEINGNFLQGLLRAQGEASLRPWLAQLFGDGQPPSGSFTATALQQLGHAERRDAMARMAGAFFPDGTQATSLRDRLAVLPGLATLPVAVLWGLADAIAPAHQRLGLPGAVAVHALPGVGHLPQVEDAALVAAVLRRQMAAASATAPAAPIAAALS
jgi:pimeloyl-ACP methyl ester carboxylesterase